MTQFQLPDAKTVLFFEGTVAAAVTPLRAMLFSSASGATIAALLGVLDYGLQFAEGQTSSERRMWGRC